MKCKLVDNNLIGFIEGELPPRLQSAIAEHIYICHECETLLENVKATYAILEQGVTSQIPSYFYTKLSQKLITKASKKSFLPRITPFAWQPVAACFVIVVGILIGISIGRQVPLSATSVNALNKNDFLSTYATEYYLDDSGEESLDNIFTNE